MIIHCLGDGKTIDNFIEYNATVIGTCTRHCGITEKGYLLLTREIREGCTEEVTY